MAGAFGERDARILKIAGNLGYRSIYWTLDSLDGVEPAERAVFDRSHHAPERPGTRRGNHSDARRFSQHC